MSGYTTSISPEMAYKQIDQSPTSNNTSWSILKKLLGENYSNYTNQKLEIIYTT